MSGSTTISKQLEHPAFDQRKLVELGLARIRELAAHTWTDHNTHDPGITMLELLAYALSDLGHRASLDIADLLASEADDARFTTARTILPNRALTEFDLRKLLIDLPGVKNAWVRPVHFSLWADKIHGQLSCTRTNVEGELEVPLGGLFEVLLDLLEGVPDVNAVIKATRQCLEANRNLCQDFTTVDLVEIQDFLLCCELDLEAAADQAVVGAEVLFRVATLLAPIVPSLSLEQALTRNHANGRAYTIDEVFEGPALVHGFILDEDLLAAELPSELRLSDIIHVIMDVPGVIAVRDVVLTAAGAEHAPPDPWLIPVADGHKAVLDITKSRLVYYKRGMAVSATPKLLSAHLDKLRNGVQAQDQTVKEEDRPIPIGRPLAVGDYYSVQNHFPAVYGIGELGLPSGADDRRRVQADQLKAYLLLFDQLMADYLAQLANIASLYSLDPKQKLARFRQVVDSLSDHARIYGCPNDAAIAAMLNKLDDSDQQLARRERFLDHLLARHAEQLTEYAALVRSVFPSPAISIFQTKCEFLREYRYISAERGLGWNRGLRDAKDLWNTPNVTGLERRLARLLGIPNYERRDLSLIREDLYTEIDGTPNDEYRFRIRKDDDTNKILLSSTTRYATPEAARAEMRVAIQAAQSPDGYSRKLTQDGRHHFTIVTKSGEIVARRIEYFHSAEELEDAITETMDYLLGRYNDEGLFVIENILLRPLEPNDALMPICPNHDCIECFDDDPYSHRVHVLLPAYSRRFENMEFRQFVERTIRAECPAHVLPKICWLSRTDMGAVEKAYSEWLFASAGVDPPGPSGPFDRQQTLQTLIEVLFRVRSVYPPARLHECGSNDAAPKFMLGRSTLGTLEEP